MLQNRRKFLTNLSLLGLSLGIGSIGYIYHEDSTLSISSYRISLTPPSKTTQRGIKFVHLSDIHNAPRQFPSLMQDILSKIAQFKPQFCLITGDLLDKRDPQPQAFFEFAEKLVQLAPSLYVTGNHEHYPQPHQPTLFRQYKHKFQALGLRNVESQVFGINEAGELVQDTAAPLALCGICDPHAFGAGELKLWKNELKALSQKVQSVSPYSILLTHRPEHAEFYAELGFTLALAGHAHGGQIRLPFIGALVAPHQGFLPRFTEGLHSFKDKRCHTLISRGIGTSVIPVRSFNKPELITLEIII